MISINIFILLVNTFNFVLDNGISINERCYNFEKKTIINSLKETNNINFLIVEGIFSKELSSTLFNKDYYFLELKINRNECMKRVGQRDLKERGKAKKQSENDFVKSWDIYYEKFNNKINKNNINEFIITKTTNIDQLIKKLFN